jgi:predicted Zn-dependent protease
MAEWLLLHDGPHEKAAHLISDALARDPNSIKLNLLQADVLLRAGQTAQARAILDRLAAKPPGAPRLLIHLAILLLKAGNTEAAQALQQPALSVKGMKLAKEKFRRLGHAGPQPLPPETPRRTPAAWDRPITRTAAKPESRRTTQASH